jgi:hypothetical protein
MPGRWSSPGSPSLPETTTLNPEEESRFRAWASANGVRDVDLPDSHYDYRGFWKQNPGFRHRQGEHFVDTFKQHGHPTFSEESRYSSGAGDGGTWNGEQFIPSGGRVMADPPGDKFAMLQELQRRQKAILGGMQADALYQQPQYPSVGDFERDARVPRRDHDGIVEMSDAPPDFRGVSTNQYQYKPEFKAAPGAGAGTYEGPMAQDLEHIPGVVATGPDGMKRVDHTRLSMANASVSGELSRSDEAKTKEIDALKKRLAALEGGTRGDNPNQLENALSGQY